MLTLAVNGTQYNGFISLSATKTMKSLCGSFTMQATGNIGDNIISKDNFPIQQFDTIDVTVDGIDIMHATAEVITIDYAAMQYTVTIVGREITGDVVDSRITATFTSTAATKLKAFVQAVLTDVGITYINVIDESNNDEPFFFRDQQIAGNGESAYNFLKRYALKKSTVLLTDSDGNIVIANSGAETSDFKLLNKGGGENNIVSAQVVYDTTKLFFKYEYVTFPNFNDINDRGQTMRQQSELIQDVTDTTPGLRKGRLFLDIDPEAFTTQKLKDRVLWRMNTNIANSRQYQVKLSGHSFEFLESGVNETIEINNLMDVVDEIAGIDETMLVETVTFNQDISGETTTINLVKKDAYSLLAEDAILSNVWYQPTEATS